jgi:hypothetical protein
VRVCLEASGNYSLDLALTLQAHRQVEISVINPRGKARLQAVVAVMRKLLHALFAMFCTNQPYDGSKLCCAVEMAGHAIAACA